MDINPWFGNPPAIWSFFGIIGSIVFLVIGFIYLWFCYFPGGYKKAEVMDIGEYAMFIAQVKVEERKKQLDKTEEEDYVNQYDELYHEMGPGDMEQGGYAGEGEDDDKSMVYEKYEQHPDWQSVGASEAQGDIEGSQVHYDDGASASSPSPRAMSQATHPYECQTSISPGSQQISPDTQEVSPSLRNSSQAYGGDDQSESTYTAGPRSHY